MHLRNVLCLWALVYFIWTLVYIIFDIGVCKYHQDHQDSLAHLSFYITQKNTNPAPANFISDIEAIKHPLERPWSIWFNSNDDKENWEDNLVELTTFDTVEDYWCLFHHMKLPSELRIGQDYALFKHGVRPAWEDVANFKGGRWVVMLDHHEIDRIWLDMVLLLIGENVENMDMICGIVINFRIKSKIVIWTANISIDDNSRIARKVKTTLGLHKKFSFQRHNSHKILFNV